MIAKTTAKMGIGTDRVEDRWEGGVEVAVGGAKHHREGVAEG